MTDKIKVKACSKEQYDVMTVKAAEYIGKSPKVKELACHIAEISTILDRMNFNAGSGWEDQAIVFMMAVSRMTAWQAAGMPPLAAANDNAADDIKLAA